MGSSPPTERDRPLETAPPPSRAETATEADALPDSDDIADAAVDPRHDPATATLWLRRSDRVLLAVLLLAGFLLITLHGLRLTRWGMQPPEIERGAAWHEYRLEINSASWVEWMQLPGIGETLARRIVNDREQNGPFASIDDLERVKGIGPKTIAKLRLFLRLDESRLDSLPPAKKSQQGQ